MPTLPDDNPQLRRLRKAELHIHLEGSLAPQTLWRLAQRHGQPFGLNSLAACERLYQFSDFSGFIQAIKTASQLLQDPADYAAAVANLAAQLHAVGVVYAEVFLSIGILLWRGVAVESYWEAVETARVAAESATGVRLRWIFDAVRQFGPEPLDQVVAWAAKLGAAGSVLGIGVGGDERQRSCAEFSAGYARARAAGLRTTIHAGETCGAPSVWDALTHLGPDRIGHGFHAAEDPRLLAALAERGVALDVCPTSNRKTGVWAAGTPHPALEFHRHGVAWSVSSDDPGIFGCTLLDEYGYFAGQSGITPADLAANSFACSFLSVAERMALLPGAAAPQPGADRGMGI